MGLSNANLKLLKYIQEKDIVSIHKLAEKFHRNISSIRREIKSVNQFLPCDKILVIKNGFVKNNLDYKEYTQFINKLSLYNYDSVYLERVHVIIVKSFFNMYVNLSHLYEDWGFSITTKKSDTKKLREFLLIKKLYVKVLFKKGIQIQGDEIRLRILVIQILLPLIELTENYGIEKRKANTPIENEMVDELILYFEPIKKSCNELFLVFFNINNRSLTYSSKKLLLLYTTFSIYRKDNHSIIENYNLPIKPLNLYLLPDKYENFAFNLIVAMLDFNPALDFQINKKLLDQTHSFLDKIQEKNVTHLYTYNEIIKELYGFFCKQIVCSQYDFSFKDKIIQNTNEQFPTLYKEVSTFILEIEKCYSIKFNEEQLSTITLILKKCLLKNKVYGRNVKKIIIVTNISFERMMYFTESLKEYVEFELVGIFDIHEVYQMKELAYDFVFIFSDRIYNIMLTLGQTPIKVNYFLEQSDIDNLLNNGFSTSKRRFVADKIALEVCNKNEKVISNFLKSKYSDFFV